MNAKIFVREHYPKAELHFNKTAEMYIVRREQNNGFLAIGRTIEDAWEAARQYIISSLQVKTA